MFTSLSNKISSSKRLRDQHIQKGQRLRAHILTPTIKESTAPRQEPQQTPVPVSISKPVPPRPTQQNIKSAIEDVLVKRQRQQRQDRETELLFDEIMDQPSDTNEYIEPPSRIFEGDTNVYELEVAWRRSEDQTPLTAVLYADKTVADILSLDQSDYVTVNIATRPRVVKIEETLLVSEIH